jgi:MFS family permease
MASSTQSIPLGGESAAVPVSTDKDSWTGYRAFVLVVCILGWSFDIFEQTIPQLVTPLIIQEWGIQPAIIGLVTTVSRWVGLIGFFIFPALADLYGRKAMLMVTIAGYSLLTGLTGFVQNWQQLLVATSATRLAISGENPVGQVMVAETAPTKWRATALGGLVGGYPFGYMLTSLAGLLVVPLLGWRALYFLGIIPALLVLFIRRGIKESPRFERVTTAMLREGLKRQLDITAPIRHYPREMLIGTLINFFYLFTWLGWSTWLPQFLASEKKLGFQTAAIFLAIWMGVAIAAYWLCGYLCDRFGRRRVIPVFVIPAGILLLIVGGLNDATSLFTVGLVLNFLITGSFGAGLTYATELFPTAIRGTAQGAIFLIAGVGSALSPLMMGYFATVSTIAAGLPVLALSFFLIAPIFLFFARETTRQELTDFVGQKVVAS